MDTICNDMKGYYTLLGLSTCSSYDDVKKRYKENARLYHPDKNDGDDTQFKKVQEAYSVLSNPQQRDLYDNNISKDDLDIGQSMPNAFVFDFNDILGTIFSASYHEQPHTNETAVKKQYIYLSIDDVVFGCTKQVTYTSKLKCKKCNGEGQTFTSLIQCMSCGGKGYREGLPFPIICHSCHGESIIKTNAKICTACNGAGYGKHDLTKDIYVEPGKPHNSQMFMKIEELNLVFKHKFDKHTKCFKNDIYIKHPITIEELLCGFEHMIRITEKDPCIQLTRDGYFDTRDVVTFKKMGVVCSSASNSQEERGDVILRICVEGTRKELALKKFKPAFVKIFCNA
jgi:molecular chaperone DnaJ